MNVQYYQKYLDSKPKRLKKQAKQELSSFIDSFTSFAEKVTWTKEFLQSGEYGHKIQSQVYRVVIFLLFEGYQKKDLWTIKWLANIIGNLYDRKRLYQKIEYKNNLNLLTEYYLINPHNEEIKEQLLHNLLNWFGYASPEYYGKNAGSILWNHHPNSIDTYNDILEHLKLARELDRENKYEGRLATFETKVNEFFRRINVLQ